MTNNALRFDNNVATEATVKPTNISSGEYLTDQEIDEMCVPILTVGSRRDDLSPWEYLDIML